MPRIGRRPGNLPAEATSFVGRRRELGELRTRLATARLVSLVGPGGVGKSRLAIRGASQLGRGFRDGAWWVELAEVRDPVLTGHAFIAAMDLRDQAALEPPQILMSFLRDKELLLVVDNCEHLLDPVARLVAEIIACGPGVRVIATSREPLSMPAEHVIPVPPLDLPPAGAPDSQLRHNEAVKLFTERAQAASGGFELSHSNQGAVAHLCRRLDGLPLAIELAAVRTRVLGVEQILDRLTDRFGLLTGGGRAAMPRHQTLRTAIDWSCDMLAADERALLRRLSVFAGRFTLEDIEGACPSEDLPPAGALAPLSSLVDKSLVIREDARGPACYRLHETMREYSTLKLEEAGERQAVELRFTEYYRLKCRLSAGEARQALVDWLDWMSLEIDNVRSALQRCLSSGDVTRGLDIAASIGWYWRTRATTEGVRWLDELLRSGDGDTRARASALLARGFLGVLQADAASSAPALERAITLAREMADLALLVESLSMASMAVNLTGDRTSAGRLLEEAHEVAVGVGDAASRLSVLQAQAMTGFFDGDLDAIREAASEGARLSAESGDIYVRQFMLGELGGAALIAGDLGEAKRLYEDALRIAHRIDDRVAQFYILDALACIAAARGDARLGARLLGAAEETRISAGASVVHILAGLLARAEESAIAAIGPEAFENEFKVGKRLSRDVAVRLALGTQARPDSIGPLQRGSSPLAKREAEVAGLVAEGLSNKQIGARLFISERTVENHVRSILNKLGFNTRAQIAGWVASSND